MIIVNVQDHADQIQQNAANLQQIAKGDILIHHTDHLPSVRMSSGSKNQKKIWPPTVIDMPSVFYYIALREKCQTLIRLQIAKKASPQQHISKKRARLWTDPKKLDKIFKKNYAKRLRVILVAFVMLIYACIRQEKVHQA